jgi:hypothetical protein
MGRRPVTAAGLVLACAWIALNAYEALAHRESAFGWFETLRITVTRCAYGVLSLAALVWLVEQRD